MQKKKPSEEDIDKLLSSLSVTARGAQSQYTSEKSYSLLEERLERPITKRFPIWKYAAAASVIFIISISVYLLQLLGSPAMLTVSTTDTLQEVILPDGTKVTLSHYTTLQYPEKFTGQTREVILIGEGFFDVSKDKKHPFIVKASEVQIKVLGTQFNVKSYANDSYTKTTLIEGSVAVSNLRNNAIEKLRPNESAIFDKESGQFLKQADKDAKDDTAWQSGVLIFNNKPLSLIADDLSNYFNIKILIPNKNLKNIKLNARFENGENMEEILNLLQNAGNFSWKKNNNIITITIY